MSQQPHNFGSKNHTFASKVERTNGVSPPASNRASAPAMPLMEQPLEPDVSPASQIVPEPPISLPISVAQQARAKAAAGQKLSLGLDFTTVVGGSEHDKAKLTAAIFHEGKKLRKIDLVVPADQALKLFIELMRGTSDDGDLLALVSRFVEELPSA